MFNSPNDNLPLQIGQTPPSLVMAPKIQKHKAKKSHTRTPKWLKSIHDHLLAQSPPLDRDGVRAKTAIDWIDCSVFCF